MQSEGFFAYSEMQQLDVLRQIRELALLLQGLQQIVQPVVQTSESLGRHDPSEHFKAARGVIEQKLDGLARIVHIGIELASLS